MELNIPKTSTASHELPIFTQMANDSDLPVSEVKARFRNKMIDKHREVMEDPGKLPLGGDNQELVHAAVQDLSQELQHPEEDTNTDDEEYNDLMGMEPGQQDFGADPFNIGGEFGEFSGGFGGDDFGAGGGGFGGGGIDNLDMGFSDDDMAAFDQVSDDEGGFGSDADAGDVNALSDIEPNAPSENAEGTSEPDQGVQSEGGSDLGLDFQD